MRDRGAAVFFAMSFALVAFAACVAIVIIAREGFGTNGAAWIQAGGSVAAIAGAVWLFRSETTRRRRDTCSESPGMSRPMRHSRS